MKTLLPLEQMAAAALLALAPLAAQAAEEEQTFMNVNTTSGQTLTAMLTNTDALFSPMLYNKERRLVVNGQSYGISEIASITFEKRMVDGISDAAILKQQAESRKQTVYDISGRPVGTVGDMPGSLPKGVYMVNGKKFIVK
ncbi:MAG: hypothetical protein J5971_02960 [Prevotella sp.]|nr:hypothetical protein [Prevotella sp.]